MVGIEEILKLVGTPRLGSAGIRKLEIDVAKEALLAQRTEHNIERMKDLKKKISERIARRYRFDTYIEKEGVVERQLYADNVKLADIKGELRYKKTPYKAVAEGMEAHLLGITFHFNRGRWMTPDLTRRGNEPYVHAEKLIDDFAIEMAGHLSPAVECNITPAIEWKEPKETLIIPQNADREISANSLRLLMQINYALPLEEAYLKKFRKTAAEGASKNGVNVTEVNSRKAVEGGSVERETTDWANVVRSLIPAPMENHDREWDPELPYLADSSKWFGPRAKEILAHYELSDWKPGEKKGMYVSVRSIYERIQQLKEEGAGKAKEHYAELKPVF